MNPALLPLISNLLGDPQKVAALAQQPSGAPPVQPQAPVQEEPEISVQGEQFPASKYKVSGGLLESLFPSTFRPGSTAGNILGNLKDAFLVQSGNQRAYAPRLQQLRESEAIENFRTDPGQSLDMLGQINPAAAMKGYGDLAERERMDQAAALAKRQADAQHDSMVRQRVAAILGPATEQTFPYLLGLAQKYTQDRGVDMPLPTDWRQAQQWATGEIPYQEQVEQNDRRNYQRDSLATQRAIGGARVGVQREAIGQRREAVQNRPPTAGSVVGQILAKQARGEKLTPDEQQVLTYYKPPKAPTGGGPRAVRQPDGSFKIQ